MLTGSWGNCSGRGSNLIPFPWQADGFLLNAALCAKTSVMPVEMGKGSCYRRLAGPRQYRSSLPTPCKDNKSRLPNAETTKGRRSPRHYCNSRLPRAPMLSGWLWSMHLYLLSWTFKMKFLPPILLFLLFFHHPSLPLFSRLLFEDWQH